MATSCALRNAFGVRNAFLSPAPMSQSQIQARAIPPICAAPALIGKRSLPNSRATRSSSAEPAFGSSRQLLGARTLPAQIQANRSHQKAPGATGGALSSQAILGLAPDTLQWIFTVASTALMFRLLPPVSHALLVPAAFLNLPARVVEVMKQEAGAWIAVALVVLRLFSSSQVPKYFDLPLAVLLSVIIAPYELLRFRGTQGAGIVSLAIGIFIAYSHASANNGIDNTMRSDVLPTTFAIALILLIPAAFLFGAYA